MNNIKSKIDFPGLLSLVIGSVIGIGIFFKFKGVLTATYDNTLLAIIAWVIGAIISMAAALTIAEIASSIKGGGGVGSLGNATFGPTFGFISGWAQIIYIMLIITSIAYFTAIFTDQAMETNFGRNQIILLAFFFVIVAFGSNILSTQVGTNVQKITTVIKLIPLIGMIIIGIFAGKQPGAQGISDTYAKTSATIASKPELIAAALIPILFAFDGWIFSTAAAGEVSNPGKNVPKAIILGLGIVGIVYVLINFALMNSMPIKELKATGVGGAAKKLTGSELSQKFVNICIAISAYGILNGYGLLSQRFIAGLAEEDNFFAKKFFMKRNEKGFPINSGLVMFGLVLITMIITAYLMIQAGGANKKAELLQVEKIADQVSNIPTVLIWTIYFVIFIGWFKIRSENKVERPFKLKGILLVAPVLVVIAVAYILYVTYTGEITAFTKTKEFPFGIATLFGVIISGIIVYFTAVKPNQTNK